MDAAVDAANRSNVSIYTWMQGVCMPRSRGDASMGAAMGTAHVYGRFDLRK